MKSVKYTICDICGEEVKARGIGGHKALKHGVVVKTIINDSGTQVDHSSNNSRTQVDHSSNNSRTRVQRPGDYVKKKSTIIETRIESAPVRIWSPVAASGAGISVISDRAAWIWGQMCKCKDYSIEKHKELEKIFNDNHPDYTGE
jgi:hypothetical protein